MNDLYFLFGSEKIFELPCGLEPSKKFTPLSAEQSQFYLLNKNATASEVLAMKLDNPPPTLDEYKDDKIKELDKLSLDTFEKLSPAYKRENARITLEIANLNQRTVTVYSVEDSMQILSESNNHAQMCRTEYYRVVGLINSAESPDEVDQAFETNNYKNF